MYSWDCRLIERTIGQISISNLLIYHGCSIWATFININKWFYLSVLRISKYLWLTKIWRNKSSIIYSHNFSLPLWYHVWRYWTWSNKLFITKGLLLIFGIYLIFFGKKLHLSTVESNRTLPEKELHQLYQIRYLLTLMGFFACYSGFIYNDFFSFSLNYVDSCVDMLNSKYLPNCIP